METKSTHKIPEKSIVVLPFINMSADPENEYFSDGVSEEIINALTRVKGIKVISRTTSFSFKKKNIDVRSIGKQLGVDTVLEGSIRKSGNRIRITAQLITTKDGFHVWSETFDRELHDIFELEDEISLLIAEKIRENFGHIVIQDKLVTAPTRNIEAYQAYLRGRFYHLKWDAEGIAGSIEWYGKSIELDPSFALPYFGIAFTYSMYGSWGSDKEKLVLAEEYLKKGFELNSNSDLGFFSRATLNFWGKWDFRQAQNDYLEALAINPSNTEAEEGLTELYTALGDFDSALFHARHILTLNPLSPNHHFTKGNIHFLMGDYSKALEYVESALRLDPDFIHAVALNQICLIYMKESRKLDEFLINHSLSERPAITKKLYSLINPGEKLPWADSEPALLEEEEKGTIFPWPLFLLVHLGNHSMALSILEEATTKKMGQYMNFKHNPMLEPLDKEDRFQRLLKVVFQNSKMSVRAQNRHGKENEAIQPFEEKEIETMLKALQSVMEIEKPFQNAAITLRSLANRLEITPNKLSWLLNDRVGHNFNEYVNLFRLETFKQKAMDPRLSHVTLLGLAYESGFNSKTVFNEFFKKMEGVTPSVWVKSKKKGE